MRAAPPSAVEPLKCQLCTLHLQEELPCSTLSQSQLLETGILSVTISVSFLLKVNIWEMVGKGLKPQEDSEPHKGANHAACALSVVEGVRAEAMWAVAQGIPSVSPV